MANIIRAIPLKKSKKCITEIKNIDGWYMIFEK